MTTTQNVIHSNSMLLELKEKQQERIQELEAQIVRLQEEIRLLNEFYDRLDDL